MGHPDFRVPECIFATIHPDPRHGMVKLTLEQQQVFVRDFPNIFEPESGAWGRAGSTRDVFERERGNRWRGHDAGVAERQDRPRGERREKRDAQVIQLAAEIAENAETKKL
jgi:hypothetical protein